MSFQHLARTITDWTTNVLATSLVLAIGLALGWQLIDWWRESQMPAPDAAALAATLPTVGQERDFWTRGGLVKVQRQTGDPGDAISAMRAFCRQSGGGSSLRTVGPGEAQFVSQLLAETPLEENPPIAIYQPPGQAAMVVAVDRNSQQIVCWSFALPTGEGAWSLYHFRPK